jgi:hypothetical protein
VADETVCSLVDACEDVPGDDTNAALRVELGEAVAQILVEAAQDLIAAIDEGRLGAEICEDTCKLDRDIAAAGDDDAPRKLRQVEGLVRGNDVLQIRILPAVTVRPDLASVTAWGPVTVARSAMTSTFAAARPAR